MTKTGHDRVGMRGEQTLSLYCENKAAINVAHNPGNF